MNEDLFLNYCSEISLYQSRNNIPIKAQYYISEYCAFLIGAKYFNFEHKDIFELFSDVLLQYKSIYCNN